MSAFSESAAASTATSDLKLCLPALAIISSSCTICGVNHSDNVYDHMFIFVQNEKYFLKLEAWDHFMKKPVFDPRLLSCGHLFSLNGGIKKYLDEHNKCPKNCSQTFSVDNLIVPPVMTKIMIDSFQVSTALFYF